MQSEVFKFVPADDSHVLVADINKSSADGFSGSEKTFFQPFDGRLYFSASNSPNSWPTTLWAKDLPDGQFSNISEQLPLEDHPYMKYKAEVFDGRLYFSGTHRDNEFRQLVSYQTGDDTLTWHGNVQPTIGLQGTVPYLYNLTAHNGKLFFNTWKDYVITQFFQFDPVSQSIELVPGIAQATGNLQFIYQDKLYCNGSLNGVSGNHLFSFDLASGTYTEIANDSILSSPERMYLLGDKIAFSAYDPSVFFTNFIRLYDPATGTFSDILPQGFSTMYIKNPVLFQGKYWYNPEYYDSGTLFWLDPATGTSELALDLTPYGLVATGEMIVFDNKLYFAGRTLEHGEELFEYDPATGLVRAYADINPGGGHASPKDFFIAENRLYFNADDGWRGRELWSLTNCFALTLTEVPDSLGQNGGQVSLDVQGGTAPFTFAWNNGATTQNLTGLASGYYEATVTDANGCEATVFTVLEGGLMVSAKEAELPQMKIYPNPANDLISIELSEFQENLSATLYSFSGVKMAEQQLGNLKENMDVSGLPAGMYFLVVRGESGGVLARKIVVD